MPYEPDFPADHAELTAGVFRAQFQGLKALIDAISSVTAAEVTAITTLPAGAEATVDLTLQAGTLRLAFGLPRGADGPMGGPGPQGPPFANALVASVTTLNPGESATAETSFDGGNVHFRFGLPRGFDGATGSAGPTGNPGEVTTAQLTSSLADALAATARNTNSVPTLDATFTNDPPTLADLEQLRSKLNELILAARR